MYIIQLFTFGTFISVDIITGVFSPRHLNFVIKKKKKKQKIVVRLKLGKAETDFILIVITIKKIGHLTREDPPRKTRIIIVRAQKLIIKIKNKIIEIILYYTV